MQDNLFKMISNLGLNKKGSMTLSLKNMAIIVFILFFKLDFSVPI